MFSRTELTFTTWNIHGCGGRYFDAHAFAEVLSRTDASVIALQESAVWEDGIDQATEIATLLGMRAVFGPNMERKKGRWKFGNALLTRLEVLDSSNHDLTVAGVEPRGCLLVRLDTGGGRELIAASTHLGLGAFERARQAERLKSVLPRDLPLVVGGDMNDWFPGRDTRILRSRLADAFTLAGGKGARATYPALLPLLRLDHVYVDRGTNVLECRTDRSPLARSVSDHLPVVARVSVVAYYGACARGTPPSSSASS